MSPSRAERLFVALNRPLGGISAILVLGMMLTIVYDMIARLAFAAPTLWVLDVNEYALVYLTFLPAAWILMRGGHVRVEIVLSRLAHVPRRVTEVVANLLGVGYCGILAWEGWQVAWEAYRMEYRFSTALALLRFPILVGIPIGAAWLAIGFAIKAWVAARYGLVTEVVAPADQAGAPHAG